MPKMAIVALTEAIIFGTQMGKKLSIWKNLRECKLLINLLMNPIQFINENMPKIIVDNTFSMFQENATASK